jgi:hypothetical protein
MVDEAVFPRSMFYLVINPVTGYQGPTGGSRGIALLILDLGTTSGWVVSTTPWQL